MRATHSLMAPLSITVNLPSLIVGNLPSGFPDASLNSSGAFMFTRSENLTSYSRSSASSSHAVRMQRDACRKYSVIGGIMVRYGRDLQDQVHRHARERTHLKPATAIYHLWRHAPTVTAADVAPVGKSLGRKDPVVAIPGQRTALFRYMSSPADATQSVRRSRWSTDTSHVIARS
jgi:hypothetical protein